MKIPRSIRLNYQPSIPLVHIKKWFFSFLIGLLIFSAPHVLLATQFIDNLTTDFYAGETLDNILISQNIDGNIELAPYGLLCNWYSKEGPSNTSLYQSSATVYNGKIYLSGGFGNDDSKSISGPQVANAIKKIWYGTVLSDGKIDEWKDVDETSVMPRPTYGHSSLTVNGKLYIIGGRSTSDATLNTVCWAKILGHDGTIKAYYKPNTWTAVAPLPEPRFLAKSIYFEGRIYVIGGQNSSDIAQNTVFYGNVEPNGNIASWNQTTSPLPARVSGHCVGTSNGRIYVLGGSTTGEPMDATADVYVGTIDLTTGDIANWQATAPLPHSLYAADATVTGGKIWVAGGLNSGTARSDVIYARINPINGLIPGPGERDTWSLSTELPVGIYFHNFISFNSHLYVIGGYNNSGTQKYVYISNHATPKINVTRWTPTTPMFLSTYGAGVYQTWTGQTALLRVPLIGDTTSVGGGGPTIYVLGGAPNTYPAFADGVGTSTYNQPAAFATIFNSQIDSNGSLKTWSSPDSGGTLPFCSILHASALANGSIYVVGGVNSMNAYIWTGAASRSLTAINQFDGLGRPLQIGQTTVLYEQVSHGSTGGGTGTIVPTAPIPIYDPNYEASVATHPPSNINGCIGNTATPIYQPLMRHTVVTNNGLLYVIGGISRQNGTTNASGEPGPSTTKYEDRVWMCRPNPDASVNYFSNAGGWQQTVPLLPTAQAPDLGPLYDLSACVAYNRIYIFGGRYGGGGTTLPPNPRFRLPQDQVYYINILPDGRLDAVNGWIELSSSPLLERLAEHQVVFLNGKVYLIGGVNDTGVLRDSVYYCTIDPTTGLIPAFPNPGLWELSTTHLEYPVAGHSAIGYNGFFYLLGGRYNPTDSHSSNTYLTSVIDLYQTQDIMYAWNGNFERYIDIGQDQLIENLDWLGSPNYETLQLKIRYAMEEGSWSPWTGYQNVGPFVINRTARYVQYKAHFETLTNERMNVFRTPSLDKVIMNYVASGRLDYDSFQINHNKFDPQVEHLLLTYKTRNQSVGDVTIRVFNLEGELIKREDIIIPEGTPLPTSGTWEWEGTNDNNELVANGIYIIQYNSGNTHKIRKVVLYKR